jgi:hypothetical protein
MELFGVRPEASQSGCGFVLLIVLFLILSAQTDGRRAEYEQENENDYADRW